MREILVFTKDVNGGIASLLEQLSRLESEDLQFTLFLYRNSDIQVFGGKVHSISGDYPANLSFSLDKIYFFALNVIQTYVLLKKYPKNTKLFACDMYAALILLLLKTLLRKKIHVICLINSNFQKIISQKSNPIYKALLKRTVKYLYRYADHIIYVSRVYGGSSWKLRSPSLDRGQVLPKLSYPVHNDKRYCFYRNEGIAEQGSVFYIVCVQFHPLMKRKVVRPSYHPRRGYSRKDREPNMVSLRNTSGLINREWSGSDKSHLPLYDINKLRNFIESCFRKEFSYPCITRIVKNFKCWPICLI